LLFNLDEDPSEKYNVASEYATIVEELTQLIQEKKNEIKSTGTFWDQ
jgi:arylsulfatase